MKVGIVGLVKSAKATMCMMILLVATIAIMTGHLDGPSFATVVSVIGSIYCWTAHKVDITSMTSGEKP